MTDIKELVVSAPIPFMELKRSFKEDVKFKVVAEDSKLSGERLLSYLHNLQVNHELIHGDRLLELVESYLHLNVVYNDPSLVAIVIIMMLRYRGVDASYDGIDNDVLDDIISRNKDILELWVIRASSLPAFSLYAFIPTRELSSEYPEDKLSFTEDGKFKTTGINFIHVISSPMVHLYAPHILDQDIKYNKYMFTEYLFSGKCMLDHCDAPDNPFLLSLFDSIEIGENDVSSS